MSEIGSASPNWQSKPVLANEREAHELEGLSKKAVEHSRLFLGGPPDHKRKPPWSSTVTPIEWVPAHTPRKPERMKEQKHDQGAYGSQRPSTVHRQVLSAFRITRPETLVLSTPFGPGALKPLYCRRFSGLRLQNHSTVGTFRARAPQPIVQSALSGPEATKPLYC